MKAIEKPKRTLIGVELVRLLASEGNRIFTVAQARAFCARANLKEEYLWEALYHLRRTGWIVSIRRGLYAISAPVPGLNPAHEFEIAMALVSPAAISHWSALHYHGLTEQGPRKIFVLTTAGTSVPRPSKAKGYEMNYQFIQVKRERFFGTETVWAADARVLMTDPERTLLDGLSRPQFCGDFAEVLHACEARSPRLDLDRIINYALRLDAATAKRLGWVLEAQGVDPSRLEPLLRAPIRSYRTLDPCGPRQGPRNRRWMIQENLPGRVAA
ncbi:MAG: type IV toxin-antitoxin system AbiEi family antitoxin domain-containing protein [Acidobacteria bacterium]|nr:type IV toxin-antitoxin system AbiEi family antitoxin domain-containing protein [Acidobacteriota bacterium]